MKVKKNKKKSNAGWILKITIMAFVISVIFSFTSELVLDNASMVVGIVALLLFIFIGVIFDMVGVAVTSADIGPFNSMSARKVFGADVAVSFIKSADKVASFCNDVVGDICGIISGSAGVAVALSISEGLKFPTVYVTLIVTGVVASLTIGGKAIGKGIAMKNSTSILHTFAKTIAVVYKPKK